MSLQKARKLTMYITTTAMIVLCIYDLIIVNTHGSDASISNFLQETGYASPIVCLCLGFLLGHFFGYFRPKWKNAEELIDEMGKRLIEVEEVGFCPKEKVYYWQSCGRILNGQCDRKNLGELK